MIKNLTICFLLCFLNVRAQRNCQLLKSIIIAIDTQRVNIKLSKLHTKEFEIHSNPRTHECSFVKNEGFENDKQLDSFLKLPNISAILNASDDSLFYTKEWNAIIDTFGFFKPQCSCYTNGKHFLVVNSNKDIQDINKYNVMWVCFVGKIMGMNSIKLQHSAEPYDQVIFFYKYIRNKVSILKIRVSDRRF